MKKFLEMIEIAKREGFFVLGKDGKPTLSDLGGEWWTAIENCNPFVFTPSEETTVDSVISNEETGIDAPFKVFSIEVLGDYICIPNPEQRHLKTYIDCILVREIQPKQFSYLSLCEIRDSGNSRRVLLLTQSEGHIVEKMLRRLKREAVGVEHVRERVKLASGADKRVATFRKIVHVRPKNQIQHESSETRNIDWNHRWSVRGHWRAIQGLGKDREGKYCIENNTWVSEYEKGPEDAPLISKVRVVKH